MRKGLIALLLVLFLVPSAFATETKLRTMGYSYLYMVDDYNMQIWPQLITNYPSLLLYEHDYAGGITMALGENDVLGFFINEYSYWVPGWSSTFSSPDDKFSLIYGHNFEGFQLGFSFNWASDFYKYENSPVYEEKVSMMALTGGFSIDVGEEHSFDFAATYQNTSFKIDTSGNEIVKSDGGTAIGFVARFNYQYNDETRLVPVFQFITDKIGYQGEYPVWAADTTDYSYTAFEFGIGCNHKPHERVELINAIGVLVEKYTYDYLMWDDKETYTYATMPYFMLGADIYVKKWLNLRFGLNKWLGTDKYKYENASDYTESWSANYFDYTVGAGINVSGLEFDCMVSNGFFNRGPYLISGDDTQTMFPYISIKYPFK